MVYIRTVLSILMILTLTTFSTFAQEIKFPARNITIREAFNQIESQTDYLISYLLKDIDLNKNIQLSDTDLQLEQALKQLLVNSNLTSSIRGNHIMIKKEEMKASIVAENLHPKQVVPQKIIEAPLKEEKKVEVSPIITPTVEEILADQSEFETYQPKQPVLDLRDYQSYQQPDLPINQPRLGLSTNLLYGFGTLTPNGSIEFGLNPKSTLVLTGGYNAWRKNEDSDNKKLWHWSTGVEYRYWLCERFNGHFFGVNALYTSFNFAGKKIPLFLEKGSENYRYQGYAAIAGISYGYQFMLAKNWNLELNAGIGIGYMKYDKWDCARCGGLIEEKASRTFATPSRLGVSIIYTLK